VTPETFDSLFDAFTYTAYRWEGLPAYAVSVEDASLRAFVDGTPRPERSVRTSPWMARIAVSTANGKQWSRTRIVDQPLTEYQRYQLMSYVESQAVGEQIALVDRADLAVDGPDFWLFDADTEHAHAVLLHYTPAGALDRFESVHDPAALTGLRGRMSAARGASHPLNEFLAHQTPRIHG
jgi:hypothetical protein